MPAPQPDADWRARWLPVLLWTGVGLVPLAALFLLLGQGGGPLRLAAVLAILASVLIGLSVMLREDSEAVRMEIEETVLDEVDGIRDEMREDVVAVARKLHGRLRDELSELTEQVEELRGRLAMIQRPGMPELAEEAAAFTRHVVRPGRGDQDRGDQDRGDQDRGDQDIGDRDVGEQDVGRASVPGWGDSAHREPVNPVARTTRAWAAPAAAIEPPREVVKAPSSRVGRRRAAEPDEPVPVAELEAPRRASDPWADLRGDTQQAEVPLAGEWHDSYR